MRALLIIYLMIMVCTLASGDSVYSIPSIDSISYPAQPVETSEQDVVNAWRGLVTNTADLGTSMAQGVIDDGGIIATTKKHKKFYGAIAIFGFLTFLWLRNRSH